MVSEMAPYKAEYAIIRHDLVKIFLLNILYLGAILALYYTNSKSHFLDNWFSSTFHL